MRLTYATVYAMHALVYLARHKGGRPLASHLIARPCGIPEPFLLKILKSLMQAGLLQSLRASNFTSAKACFPGDCEVKLEALILQRPTMSPAAASRKLLLDIQLRLLRCDPGRQAMRAMHCRLTRGLKSFG